MYGVMGDIDLAHGLAVRQRAAYKQIRRGLHFDGCNPAVESAEPVVTGGVWKRDIAVNRDWKIWWGASAKPAAISKATEWEGERRVGPQETKSMATWTGQLAFCAPAIFRSVGTQQKFAGRGSERAKKVANGCRDTISTTTPIRKVVVSSVWTISSSTELRRANHSGEDKSVGLISSLIGITGLKF
ncbi:hypothetical protein K438DRAFT_1748334 [Mycena galopus ATCC 62051]|nr:hypothetical protein K438DRAFT_1748334 [Mycena galopus ATCC 62051]